MANVWTTQSSSWRYLYADTGSPILTDDGQFIILNVEPVWTIIPPPVPFLNEGGGGTPVVPAGDVK
jgi:hypothetical protein